MLIFIMQIDRLEGANHDQWINPRYTHAERMVKRPWPRISLRKKTSSVKSCPHVFEGLLWVMLWFKPYTDWHLPAKKHNNIFCHNISKRECYVAICYEVLSQGPSLIDGYIGYGGLDKKIPPKHCEIPSYHGLILMSILQGKSGQALCQLRLLWTVLGHHWSGGVGMGNAWWDVDLGTCYMGNWCIYYCLHLSFFQVMQQR